MQQGRRIAPAPLLKPLEEGELGGRRLSAEEAHVDGSTDHTTDERGDDEEPQLVQRRTADDEGRTE